MNIEDLIPPIELAQGRILAVIKKTDHCVGTPYGQIVNGALVPMKGSGEYHPLRQQLRDALKEKSMSMRDLEGRFLYPGRGVD